MQRGKSRTFFPARKLSLRPVLYWSQNVARQIRVPGEVADMLVHIGRIDHDTRAGTVGRVEGDVVQHPLHYGLQPPSADVLDIGIEIDGDCGEAVYGVVGEFELHPFRRHQRHILLDEARLRLGEDAPEILLLKRAQLHANGQSALKLGQEVGRLRYMEGARGDEQDVIRLHRSVFGRHRRAFNERKEVPLHTLARNTRAQATLARGNLVDLVEKDDAVILRSSQRTADYLVLIEQLEIGRAHV